MKGQTTGWDQVMASDESQVPDNDLVWEIMFVHGESHPALRTIRFLGMPAFDPLIIRDVLIDKQKASEALVREAALQGRQMGMDRCVLCRLPFGSEYDDPTFGRLTIKRNRRNRYYCNVCDAFIRICPGEATLTLPVLVVDVKGSRAIRREVGSLRAFSALLASFHRRVASIIQENMGFVLNTVGDAVVGVWPSGFVPREARLALGWDPENPACIPARQALEAARMIAANAPAEFDGTRLPFRAALDTTEMIIFSVTTGDPGMAGGFDAVGDAHEVGDPVLAAEASDIGQGPAATDIAGQAVETATDLANREDLPAGAVCITRRTDVAAGVDAGLAYGPEGVDDTEVRIIGCT